MRDLPIEVIAGTADRAAVAELEVSFVAENEWAAGSAAAETETGVRGSAWLSGVRGRAARQAALALGQRVLGEAGAVHALGGVPLQAAVGLGPRADITAETLRRAAGHAVACATDLRRGSLAIQLPQWVPRSMQRNRLAAKKRAGRPQAVRRPLGRLRDRGSVSGVLRRQAAVAASRHRGRRVQRGQP